MKPRNRKSGTLENEGQGPATEPDVAEVEAVSENEDPSSSRNEVLSEGEKLLKEALIKELKDNTPEWRLADMQLKDLLVEGFNKRTGVDRDTLRTQPLGKLKEHFADTNPRCWGDAIGFSLLGSMLATVAGGGITAMATESLMAAGTVATLLSGGIVALCLSDAKKTDRKNKQIGEKITTALPAPEKQALPAPIKYDKPI